jgi:60S ribosomal subunit assembly/export protein LOC1
MAPSRTSTVKSKHATNKSGIRNSKNSGKPQGDGVSKQRKPKSKGPPPKPQKSVSNLATLKKKRRVYSEKELDIPALNMITPIGVEKPKGKKKGKVFVDDQVRYFAFYYCGSLWGKVLIFEYRRV